MALTDGKPIYTGQSKWLRIPDVKIEEVLVTEANAPESFTYRFIQHKATVGNGDLAHSPDVPGTWEKKVILPTTSGVTIAQAVLTDDAGNTVEVWQETFVLEKRA